MYKYILLACLSFSCHAAQTKQEIIDYCTKTYQEAFGNSMVYLCIKNELRAQEEVEKFRRGEH